MVVITTVCLFSVVSFGQDQATKTVKLGLGHNWEGGKV
jgi:hypothetical protein